MRLIILGSGTSFGIPQIGCHCEVCRSTDPRDRRTRVGAVLEGDHGQRILIDTPPELRLQLVGASIDTIDAVLYTHDHADHVQGIDDLRAISVRLGRLPIYGPPETLKTLQRRFGYIFDTAPAIPGTPKPELSMATLEPERDTSIAGFTVRAIPVEHGSTLVYAYRIGTLGYVTDAKSVSPSAVAALKGVRVLVLNALFEHPHATHLSIPEAIDVAHAIGAERTLFTHITHRTSHAGLMARLPRGIEPAYDGLTVTF